jgi:hypothetical protein
MEDQTNAAIDGLPRRAIGGDREAISAQAAKVSEIKHVYAVRPRKDHRGVNLISDALPFGRLWHGQPNAISYAKFYSRSHNAVIRVYDESRNVIDTHEQTLISCPGF